MKTIKIFALTNILGLLLASSALAGNRFVMLEKSWQPHEQLARRALTARQEGKPLPAGTQIVSKRRSNHEQYVLTALKDGSCGFVEVRKGKIRAVGVAQKCELKDEPVMIIGLPGHELFDHITVQPGRTTREGKTYVRVNQVMKDVIQERIPVKGVTYTSEKEYAGGTKYSEVRIVDAHEALKDPFRRTFSAGNDFGMFMEAQNPTGDALTLLKRVYETVREKQNPDQD